MKRCLPERIPHDQERHVYCACIGQDRVRIRLDHVAVGYNDGLAIEGFLAETLHLLGAIRSANRSHAGQYNLAGKQC